MVRSVIPTVSLIAVLVMAAANVHAADDSSAGDDAKYKSTLKEALAEYDASHFEEARILFRKAHELNPNARTLRSIGMASFELRDYVAALRALTAALVETRKPLNAEQRAHAQGLLQKSRMFVDVYTLKVSPDDAKVLLDGRPVDAEPDGTILLGFGNHTFEASKPGYTTRTLPVNVRGGEHKDLAMTLEKKMVATARPVPEVNPTPAPTVVAKAPAASNGNFASTAWFIGAGAAALAAGGAGILWGIENNELNKCHNPPSGYQCTDGPIVSRRNLAVGATIGAGAVAITAAVMGFLTRDSGSSGVAFNGLQCALSPSGVLCQRAF